MNIRYITKTFFFCLIQIFQISSKSHNFQNFVKVGLETKIWREVNYTKLLRHKIGWLRTSRVKFVHFENFVTM
jgi:hypothetical protein